jgi:5-formyltetrahydrofolate cyclo-ligase
MVFAEAHHAADAAGPLGLSEPAADAPTVPLDEIDVFILPGLAFSFQGARLGWGRGHFDATLARVPRAVRLAWAYEFQLVPDVPETPADERVDVIVTDAAVRETHGRPVPGLWRPAS